jgi:hypothetical protein
MKILIRKVDYQEFKVDNKSGKLLLFWLSQKIYASVVTSFS